MYAWHAAILCLYICKHVPYCGSPQKWIRSTLTKGQRIQAYSCSFKDVKADLTQGVAAYRVHSPRCGHCRS